MTVPDRGAAERVSGPPLLAVDGGNSKTDVMLLDPSGTVLAHVRGPSCAPVQFGIDGAMDRLGMLIGAAAGPVAAQRPGYGVFALAGADLPHEEAELAAACAERGWTERSIVCNDVFAVLHLGSGSGAGVAVVCGAGINAVGVGADGAVVRFPALGAVSGDWGGGYDVGMAALGAAVRAQDGRGPATSLEASVPAYFALADPMAVMTAMHVGDLDELRVVELPPLLFRAARAGDAVAVAVVERLGAEVVALASAALRRLGLSGGDPDVVLGGGLLRARLPLLEDAVRAGILAVAPGARIHHACSDPVVGAALIALADVGAPVEAAERLRRYAGAARPVALAAELGQAVRR